MLKVSFRIPGCWTDPSLLRWLLASLDGVGIFVVCMTAALVSKQGAIAVHWQTRDDWAMATYVVGVALFTVLGCYVQGIYERGERGRRLWQSHPQIRSLLLGVALILWGSVLATAGWANRLSVVSTIVLSFVGYRGLWSVGVSRRQRRVGRKRQVIIVGEGRHPIAIRDYIEGNPELGVQFCGFVADEPNNDMGGDILGGVGVLPSVICKRFIDDVLISGALSDDITRGIVESVRGLRVTASVIPSMTVQPSYEKPLARLGSILACPLLVIEERLIGRILKRICDVVLSTTALVLLSPIMCVVALAIVVDSKGPVLYRSVRVGLKGKKFTCLKFRTMVARADEMREDLMHLNEKNGILFKIAADPRITRVGYYLRRYSLDEIPQFLNVLRGEMSLVGPRPPISTEVEQYQQEHYRRLAVLPGITGLWQVEARSDSSSERYFILDLIYVQQWTFWLDCKILVRTIGAVIQGTGC